ncbi:beta-propeller domain-containing protein [Sphingomonas sp. G-3-2-10]|uniref:beta-propeller domain-containing protein n=1 Tax=Sphingomonas sp. G-3-2-10 TaxID=2728838 RepID=UPI00146A0942|nr:beta-propeller domain-containing protein [Sphingomonas sp. G-3-2-10]NML04620.1 hypothetical protein [Sphingomonas sp. G-3-2-10]
MSRPWMLLLATALALPLAAHAQTPDPETRPLPRSLTSPTLERFSSEGELRAYLRRVRAEAKKRGAWWAGRSGPVLVAQLQDPQDPPCPTPEDCPKGEGESILVTGSRAAPPASITNVQEAGVDEGDIVKQIGPFLLVLQDGRIFAIDTRGRDGLALVDRVNVYRDKDSGAWYDEMLVQDDHVIVTAYSYEEDATEVSVFSLSKEGKLASEGVFLMSSNDYYDTENYATRLVGDQLVVYAPLDLTDFDPDSKFEWPVVRRWLPEAEREKGEARGVPLFDARSIYKPIQETIQPTVHTISTCPIGAIRPGRDMRCRTTAVIGPGDRQFYVTPTDAWLWVGPANDEYDPSRWDPDCDEWGRRGPADAHPAALFRMPLSGDEPTALRTKGMPFDQFSFDARDGRFRALLGWVPIVCGGKSSEEYPTPSLHLMDVPLSALDWRPYEAPARAYTLLPSPGARMVENRFTDTQLVYAGRTGWGHSRPYDADDDDFKPLSTTAVAVPLRDPRAAKSLSVPHSVVRLERIGEDAVMTGYTDGAGLKISVLDLSGEQPRLGAPTFLRNRFESEGRSHAFNSMIAPAGDGLFGLPTVVREDDDTTWYWRSAPSDISFFAIDRAREVTRLGELKASPRDSAVDPDYECEVSCIDWYGNSRPIFTGGRVFALSGTELVEGKVEGARIVEIRRLNLSKPLAKPATETRP